VEGGLVSAHKEFVLKVSFDVPDDNEYDDESYEAALHNVIMEGAENQDIVELDNLVITPLVKGGAINRGYWAEETTGREPQADFEKNDHEDGNHKGCEECDKIREARRQVTEMPRRETRGLGYRVPSSSGSFDEELYEGERNP
jgi:hypothetical protein